MSKIFLSLVTSEFLDLRKRLAKFLLRTNLVTVQHQEGFVETGERTLQKLQSEIKECDYVLHVIGGEAGYPPPQAQVTELLEDIPDFEELFPNAFKLARDGKVTYTQWEAWLALHYKKTLCRYQVTTHLGPEDDETVWTDDQRSQRAHANSLAKHKIYATKAIDSEQVFDEILHSLIALDLLSKEEAALAIPPNNLPFSTIGTLFKGREEFLAKIGDGLKSGAEAIDLDVIKSAKPTAVYGSGGIGKTRAAIEYAWQNEATYNGLLFIEADSPEQLESSLAKLYGVLKIEGLEQANDERRITAVLNWLASHPGWLAIIDNADTLETAEAVKKKLAQLSAGHVLITSRVSRWGDAVKKLDLGVLSLPAATEYLLEAASDRTKAEDDPQQAEDVAKKVGHLALGLEHAKAYLNRFASTFAEYLQEWEQDEASILKEFDGAEIDYPRELLVTWKLSVDRLDDDARKLFEALAWFAPDPIPESVFENLPTGFLTQKYRTPLADLVGLCLVSRERGNETQSISLHRLVQVTTRLHLKAAEAKTGQAGPPETTLLSLEAALFIINTSFVGDSTDVRTWPVLEPLVEHAQAICEAVCLHSKTTAEHSTARLLNDVGLLLAEKIRFSAAEKNFRRALLNYEQSLGKDHPNVAISLNNLAMLLQETDRLKEAEPLMRRALSIDEKSYGKDHPNVATDLNNLAQLLQATNRLDEAEPLMRRALSINEKSYGKDHPNVATSLSNLAMLLKATDRHDKAEPMLRRVLSINEQAFGKDHPRVAAGLSNLAMLLKATDRHDKAEPMLKRALSIDEQSFGKDHPNVALGLSNLALLLMATNRHDEAEPMLKRALTIDEHSFGKDHPNVAMSLNNLARLLQATNRLDEAEPLMRRHVVIFLQFTVATGHPHPHLQGGLINYRILLLKMGRSKAEVQQEIANLMTEHGVQFAGDITVLSS